MRSVAELATADTRGRQDVHPLVASAARLAGLDARVRFETSVPAGDGWVTLTEAARAENVRARLDALGGWRRGMRGVAAAQLAASLACCVVRPVMALLFVEHRVPDLDGDTTLVQAVDGGRFERLVVLPGTVTALPADPTAGRAEVRTVAGQGELLEVAADLVEGTLSPALRTIRGEGRYGMSQLWGAVLDMIGATSLLTARIGGLDQQQVWSEAQRLCGMVQARAEQPTASNPRPFPVTFSGGEALYTVKGTCCLRYREHGLRAGEAPADGSTDTAYCKTCPFLRDDARLTRCSEQMERETKTRR